MLDSAWWYTYGPSIVVPSAALIEVIVLLWYGITRGHRPIKALGLAFLPISVTTGVLIHLSGPAAAWLYALWAAAGTAAMIAGAAGRKRGVFVGGMVMFLLAVAGYLPVSFSYVIENNWTFAAIFAGVFCGSIVTVLGLRENEPTANITGIGCILNSVGTGVLWLLVGNLPSHLLLVPFLGIGAFGVIRGCRNAEGRAVISALFITALACAFYGSAFAPDVASKGWVFVGLGAGWLFGVACGAICALRHESPGALFGAGWVVSTIVVAVLWLDFGGINPVWVLIPLQALSAYAIVAGAGGKADGTLACGIAGTLVGTGAYVFGFWNIEGSHIGAFLPAAFGLLLGSLFASPARDAERPITRFLARATAIASFVAGAAHIAAGSLPFYAHATPFFIIAASALLIGSSRHERTAMFGGIVWAVLAALTYWLAFAPTVSQHPLTSTSIALNVSLLLALVGYRLWVGDGVSPQADLANQARRPLPALATAFPAPAPKQRHAGNNPTMHAQPDDVSHRTRDAWAERRKTLESVDPMWQEAKLHQWVKAHRPTFWTCSTEWREHVADATCPICSRGFGLNPDSNEEDEEAPAFLCGNPQCRAVMHRQCFLQARGTMNMCPGIEGCPSQLADDFKPIYRFSTNGAGPSRYHTLPEIRARAKELGIENWDRLTRMQMVREIQNLNRHEPCFGTKPEACPEPECIWRENCLTALNIERFRASRAQSRPAHSLPPPGGVSGSFATSAKDLEFAAPQPMPAPMPGPMPTYTPTPNQTETQRQTPLPSEPSAPPHIPYSPLKPRAIPSFSPMFGKKGPDAPDIANQTFLQGKSETATPLRNPVLRWPPKQEPWIKPDPE